MKTNSLAWPSPEYHPALRGAAEIDIGIDEEGTLNALREVRRDIVSPALSAHGGRIANTAGDSFLLEFPSVVDAVRCALAVQQTMTERYAGVPEDRRIMFRVGINVGDVVADGTRPAPRYRT